MVTRERKLKQKMRKENAKWKIMSLLCRRCNACQNYSFHLAPKKTHREKKTNRQHIGGDLLNESETQLAIWSQKCSGDNESS